ncbi:hypothetical protein [Opitutus terrae]|uniref:Glycosyltransferase RgtA/B/C/D-like domain-containing protein n=1 Tax=Opitutus terrae (strain DSM 11246 / JCM 15787 / PB90-1) TaxID=452637 RepID=B1ZZT9_OPITP|nr:hypothetical protein [Opitutus terrae]ACB77275.1 hypothetical protein Oter_4001 [Opitutus terrae PB90-1]
MFLRRFAPLFCLAALALAIWCGFTHRWTLEAWRTPLQLHGDPLEIYTRVQAAAEDLSQPLRGYSVLPRLAAPLEADWSRYPVSDRVVFTLLGGLARVAGVFAAVNIAIALTHVLNALGFYLVARFLRWRHEWAMALGLLFAFSSYNFRWGVTVSFSLSFVVPLLLLFCAWVARSAPAIRPRGWLWFGIALGAWFGGANPYLGFFAAQLAAGAVVLQLLRRRDFARWRVGLIFVLVTGLSFLLHNAAYFLSPAGAAQRLTLVRNYAGAEIYALKLTDLLIPPMEHPLAWFNELGRAYYAQSALRTEFFINYLGIFGILGLVLLVVAGIKGMVARRSARLPDAFLGLCWTLLFSAVGGINSLLAFAGLDVFRASNRNSVFILVWVLLFLGAWIQRRWRPRSLAWRWALPALIVGVGVFDSLPKLRVHRMLQHNATELAHNAALAHALEQRLGRGAMVFQLPATVFPEAGTVVRMTDYEHFLPYLLSDSLRFSYGALRGTAASRSIRALSRLPTPRLKQELEAAGFSALWINVRGVPDQAGPLLTELRALGLEEFPQKENPDVRIFLLQPQQPPRPLDLTNPAFYERWDVITALTRPEIVVLDGWYDLEQDGNRSWRWARDVATTSLRMPTGGRVELRFRAYSLEPGQLVVTCRGREVYRHIVSGATRDLRTIELRLPAGRHPLDWRFTGRVTYPPAPDGRELGFAIEDLSVVPVDQPPPRS